MIYSLEREREMGENKNATQKKTLQSIVATEKFAFVLNWNMIRRETVYLKAGKVAYTKPFSPSSLRSHDTSFHPAHWHVLEAKVSPSFKLLPNLSKRGERKKNFSILCSAFFSPLKVINYHSPRVPTRANYYAWEIMHVKLLPTWKWMGNA